MGRSFLVTDTVTQVCCYCCGQNKSGNDMCRQKNRKKISRTILIKST